MAINSLNSLPLLGTPRGVSSTQGSSSSEAIGGASSSMLSSLTNALEQLQHLKQSNPDQFDKAVSQVTSQLQILAQSTGDHGVSALAARFAQAGKTGDLSQVVPPAGAPPDTTRALAAYTSGVPSVSPDQIAQVIQGALSDVGASPT